MTSFQCPSCKATNRHFSIVHPKSQSAAIDPTTGAVLHQFINNGLDSFPTPYPGPQYQVQCPECGLVESEQAFLNDGSLS